MVCVVCYGAYYFVLHYVTMWMYMALCRCIWHYVGVYGNYTKDQWGQKHRQMMRRVICKKGLLLLC